MYITYAIVTAICTLRRDCSHSSAKEVHLLELRAVRAQRVVTLRRLTERSARYSRSLYDRTSTANSDNLYVHFYSVLASSLLRSHSPLKYIRTYQKASTDFKLLNPKFFYQFRCRIIAN